MYTTKDLIINYLGQTPAASLDPLITLVISAVQNFIENYCGDEEFGKRVFEKPDSDTDKVRYFDGNGRIKIFIGEAVSISALEIDGSAQTINEDYFLKPYNALDIGKPYDTIELVQPSGNQSSRAKALYEITADQHNVKVTGKFRYSDTAPADIQLAATQLASSVISEAIDDGIKSETLGDYRVDYASIKKTAESLGLGATLNPYKRKTPIVNAGTRIAS